MSSLRTIFVVAVVATSWLSACSPNHHNSYRWVHANRTVDTTLARQLNAQGVQAFDEGDLAAAEDLLAQALDADVAYGPAHNNLGRVYHETDRLYKAAWEYQYAIRLMPHHPAPKNNLGLILESVHRLDESVDHYRQAMDLAPDNPEYIGNLVRAKSRRGDASEDLVPLLKELVLKDERAEWKSWGNDMLTRAKSAP